MIDQRRRLVQDRRRHRRIGAQLLHPRCEELLRAGAHGEHARVEGARFGEIRGAGAQAVHRQRAQHPWHQGDRPLVGQARDQVVEPAEDLD